METERMIIEVRVKSKDVRFCVAVEKAFGIFHNRRSLADVYDDIGNLPGNIEDEAQVRFLRKFTRGRLSLKVLDRKKNDSYQRKRRMAKAKAWLEERAVTRDAGKCLQVSVTPATH